MTPLNRPIKRKADIDREQVVVTLYPGSVIGLRRSRTRKEYTLSLKTVYRLAIEAEADRVKREKAKARGRKVRVRRGLL